jgi:hypothetical protein
VLFVFKTNKGHELSWLRGGMGIVVQRSMEERHDARWETLYEGPSDEYCEGSMLGIHDSRRWPIYWYRAKATGIPGQSIDSAWCDPVKAKPAGG